MKKIAITGTIGSGKSECSRIIQKFGYTVFNCDQEVSNIYQSNHPKLNQLKEMMPEAYIDNQWNKNKIAEIIFSDEDKKQLLESIFYPILLERLLLAMQESDGLFFAEVPLLFQIGWDTYFDNILVVTCSDEIALKRLTENRNMSYKDAKKRLEIQKNDLYKIERASKIIYNNSTIHHLENEVINWLETEILSDGTKSKGHI